MFVIDLNMILSGIINPEFLLLICCTGLYYFFQDGLDSSAFNNYGIRTFHTAIILHKHLLKKHLIVCIHFRDNILSVIYLVSYTLIGIYQYSNCDHCHKT